MNIETVADFRKAVRMGPYAWPGGYPLYWITSDGGALSWEVCKTERHNILWSLHNKVDDGWRVVALDVNYEDDIICDHTGKQIEAAYT